jgi:hypothetical protein
MSMHTLAAGDGLAPGDRVTEAAMAAAFRDGVDPLTGASLGPPLPAPGQR